MSFSPVSASRGLPFHGRKWRFFCSRPPYFRRYGRGQGEGGEQPVPAVRRYAFHTSLTFLKTQTCFHFVPEPLDATRGHSPPLSGNPGRVILSRSAAGIFS